MRFLKKLVYIWPLLLMCVCTRAQDPYYININKQNGLPSSSIYDLFQDSRGFIWISSNEGLTRYDGFEFKTYTNNRQTSLSGNRIEEDKYGRIWYQNFDGFLYYVTHDSLKALKQNTTVGQTGYAIINDKLLTMQKGGVDIFDIKTLKIEKTIPLDLNEFVSALHYKENFCMLLNHTIVKISETGAVVKTNSIPTGVLVGGKNGLRLANLSGDEKDGSYTLIDERNNSKISTPVHYIQGVDYCNEEYWLFTPKGAYVYNEAGTNINNNQPLFSTKNISSVLRDREGNYWIGTLDNGILFVPDLKTKLISRDEIVPNILLATNNLLYIGTKENTIYAYDLAANNFACKYKDPIRHEILSMMADTVNKLFLFSAAHFMIASNDFRDIENLTYSVKDIVAVDRKYCAYAATGVSGLLRMRNDVSSPWDSIYDAHPVPNRENLCQFQEASRGRTVAYDPASGIIYSGSNQGLYRTTSKGSAEIKLNNESVYTRKLVNYGSKTYLLTPQNNLYAITTPETISNIKVAEGQEQLLNLRKVGNSLYLLTSNGIRVLDTLAGTFNLMPLNPGIRSEEINDLAIVADKFVIATDKGLIVIDTNTSQQDTTTPGFIINKILANGKKVADEALACLPYTSNDIDIFYSVLSFSVRGRHQLYYKINDGNWQLAANTVRNLKLVSLSPGNYDISFELRAANGKVYPRHTLSFTIKKPFWTKWWFWSACFAALSVSGYAYYKWQTSLLKKQNALVLEKVELEKNLRNSMLTSIRAQMNPHFFYNALNTIQSFIFSDDKRNASSYLVKLSRLTRMILEMSEKESISLDEENDALKLYLELEKMRFSDDFNYAIRISNEVDSEFIKIPSMIVQPYVENAIKHGLLHRSGAKRLSIEFSKINGNLCVTIDDNGIGREKANEINQVKKDKHHPFSTHANSKRIELLNKERNKSIGIVYIDKEDETGTPTGTTVIISIPLT